MPEPGERLILGKVYRPWRDAPVMAVALPVNGKELALVGWPHGQLTVYTGTAAVAVRDEPTTADLCASWGIQATVLDKYLECRVYRENVDVQRVRRDPMRRA